MRKVAKILWPIVGIGVLMILMGTLVIISKVAKESPDVTGLVLESKLASRLLDDQGKLVAEFTSPQNTNEVSLEEIPLYLRQAILVLEDEHFYEHGGVDYKKMGKAMFNNLTESSFSHGGATITEQLIKNQVVTSDQRLVKRLQTIYLGKQLEKYYSKDEILTYYLNTIAFGQGTCGVGSAAKRYFGKSVSDLDLVQSVVLAVIVDLPTYYNPISRPEQNWEQVKNCLEKMEAVGYITENQKQVALTQNPYALIESVNKDWKGQGEGFSYFTECVYAQVLEDLENQLGYSHEAAIDLIYNGGLCIKTSLNTRLQHIIDDYLNEEAHYVDELKTSQTAFLLSDYKTGEVQALYGGRHKTVAFGLNYATQNLLTGLPLLPDLKEDLGLGNLGQGISLLQLNAKYNVIANEGNYREPCFYTVVLDATQKVLLDRSQRVAQSLMTKAEAQKLAESLQSTKALQVEENLESARTLQSQGNLESTQAAWSQVQGCFGKTASYIKKPNEMIVTAYTPKYSVTMWLGTSKEQVLDEAESLAFWSGLMKAMRLEEKSS